ncbi:MAG TPA: metalloregulator ArsR/SmtB family transcription factor [Actinomycetota bacterium]|nr:metalloregulator ArsR/SmtB family transcription factor [Actinomycetota bacterium]
MRDQLPDPPAEPTATATRGGASGSAAACCAPLAATSLTDAEARATADLFKALGDRHRVRIVNLLATSPDPVCVCDLTPALGLSQPTVSHHLKKLVLAGLLRREQRGTWAYYSLDQNTLRRLAAVVDPDGATAREGATP